MTYLVQNSHRPNVFGIFVVGSFWLLKPTFYSNLVKLALKGEAGRTVVPIP